MPRSTELTFACPCGTNFAATIYQSVNVTLEPQLLYRLLYGTLNVGVCPNCGRHVGTAQPFVYHDMKRSLFAYVLPSADVPEETREALLNELRRVYTLAVEQSERMAHPRSQRSEQPQPTVRRRTPSEDLAASIEPDAPPMQVIFGIDRLVTLVDSLLEPEEKLGKVAVSARNAGAPERERLLATVRRMADQLGCLVDVEDEPGDYTLWMYGPRARVATLSKVLNATA